MALKIGVLGTADVVVKNNKALNSAGLQLVALGSRSLECAQNFIKEHNLKNVKAYGNYDDVIQDPNVQAVYIPLPSSCHLEWVKKACQAKKHILLEKPIALKLEDAKEMVDCLKKSNVAYMDGTMWMHNPRTSAMEQALFSKQVMGPLKSVKAEFSYQGDENFFGTNIRVKKDLDGLGCIGDLGWYCIRASLWAFQFELPCKVTRTSGSFNEEGVPVRTTTTLLWKDGRTADFYCSFTEEWKQYLEINGEKGSLVVNDPFFHKDFKKMAYDFVPIRGEIKTHFVESDLSQEALMWKTFAKFCSEGQCCKDDASCQHWLDMSYKTQIVCNAIYDSLKNGGKEVDISCQ